MEDPVFFASEDAFRDWIVQNPNATEVWVGYFRISTGRPSLTWSTSVDVALCFGWIDGIRKTIDAQSYKIRFTPRKIASVWSAVNVKRVNDLISLGRMTPEGLRLFNERKDTKGYTSADRNVELSGAFEDQVKANPAAWKFLTNLAPSYRRNSIWWVMSAKKEETQLRRLAILIESSEAGLKIPSMRKK